MRWSTLFIVASFVLLVSPRASDAAPGMFVGVSDDAFEWNTGPMVSAANDLGLRAIRVALTWTPGERTLTPSDAAALGTRGRRCTEPTHRARGAEPGRSAARSRESRRVLLVSRRRGDALPAHQRRRDLERAEPERVLAPAVRTGRAGRTGAVRGARRRLLRPAARDALVDQRDRAGDVGVGQRQPERLRQHLPLADDIHPGNRRRLSREWPHEAALRHDRPPSVSDELERAAVVGALRPGDHLARRSRATALGAQRRVLGHRAGASRAGCADLVPRDRVPDDDPGVEVVALLRCRDLARRAARRRLAGAAARASAGLEPGARPGDAARRRAAADVLPAVRRRRLQLHARGRAVTRRLAVRPPVGRRDAEGLLPTVQGGDRRGELRLGRLQPGRRSAVRHGDGLRRSQPDARVAPVDEACAAEAEPDQGHVHRCASCAVRVPAPPRQAHARCDVTRRAAEGPAAALRRGQDRVRRQDEQGRDRAGRAGATAATRHAQDRRSFPG